MATYEVHRPITPGHAALPPVKIEAASYVIVEDGLDFVDQSATHIATFARGQWAYVVKADPDPYTAATAAVS